MPHKKEESERIFVSWGSLGAKIKKYRELRGLTQKQLGMLCGFSATTADVRIGQYENNKKVPRDKALKDLARALEIDESALLDGDMLFLNNIYHALFDIEDFHGLHPVKKGDTYYLEFSGETVLNRIVTRKDYSQFLEDWYEMREKCEPEPSDTKEQIEQKRKEYALWRGEYPNNVLQEAAERRDALRRMNHLQAEMDILNAQVKSEEELSRIDAALEPVMPSVKENYTPITLESEFIYIVKEMITGHIGIERTAPDEEFSSGSQFWHVLSIRTEELLNDENKLALFAKLVCAVETIQSLGVQIERSITSRKSELFITYKCPNSQYLNFNNLSKHWDDMMDVINGKGVFNDTGRQYLENKFREMIAGENDVRFPAKEVQ